MAGAQTVTAVMAASPDPAALAGQERIKFLLGVGAVVLVALITLTGWIRSRRRHRGTPARHVDVLALANAMIPPEVRRTRPDARIRDLSSPQERALWRRHGAMLLVALCLPVLGLASILSDGVRDALSWAGDHSVLVIIVAAPIAILFVRSQIRLAATSIDHRSELLGLAVVRSPGLGVGWRAGMLKPVPIGGVVREGVRHGRPVRVGAGTGGGATVETIVECAAAAGRGSVRDGRWTDAPAAWRSFEPGPGDTEVEAGPGGVVVRRAVTPTTSTLDVVEAELRDLRLAEQIADLAATAPESRSG